MNALALFTKYAPNRTFLAVLFGALSGMFYAFLIPIVLSAVSQEGSSLNVSDEVIHVAGFEIAHSGFASLFLILLIFIMMFKSVSEIVLAHIAQDIRLQLRKQLYRQVQASPTAALESVGASRLIQALATDVSAIVIGAQMFPALVTNSVTLLSMLGYLAYLDFDIFVYILQIILFGVITYQLPVWWGTRFYVAAREHKDILQEAFRGLIGGAKELKLCVDKQKVYEKQVLIEQEVTIMGLEKKGLTAYSLANNYGGLLCFFAIGGLSFIYVNYHVVSNTQLIAIVMVLLYVTGPISMLLEFIPRLAQTRIALRKIEKLYKQLPDENFAQQQAPIGDWKSLKLRQVQYSHQQQSTESTANMEVKPFGVGPVDIDIKRGEITFIAGGNGSGKSTLSKVISQHYLPVKGEVYFDDELITPNNIISFRQQISCIYSDYYLFDRLLGVDTLQDDYVASIRHYLEAFGLDSKVEIKDGHFSTLKLSDGQRRRLALVVAIVEDKALYVFDEWAADQDPQFKTVFYREILPYLKNKNKAVVVISHDDRFFDVADQLLVMESGQLVSTPDEAQLSSIGAASSGRGL